jgi:hypothetical protein
MEELLAKAKIKDSQLKSLISRVVAKNLSSLAEPCFYPELKKHYYEFLKLSGLTEKDVKEFVKRRWVGKKEAKFSTNTNTIANFLIFLLQYYLNKNDKQTYNYVMVLYNIRHYANLMHKHITKFCNPDAFKYALETLTKTHLFAREKTISNAIYYMAQVMIRRWTTALQTNDLDAIGMFMRESRHRVSQSIKSFAQTYYKIAEQGIGIKSDVATGEDDENGYQAQSAAKSIKLIDDTTKKITIYNYSDRKSQEEARKISKINSSLATQIISKLNNTKYSDQIRLIFKLYIKGITTTNQLCGKDYEKYIRELMSLKRTRQKVYFKQQINILLIKLLKDFKYMKKYEKLTPQTQFLINLFLAYYLTMLMRKSICIN